MKQFEFYKSNITTENFTNKLHHKIDKAKK